MTINRAQLEQELLNQLGFAYKNQRGKRKLPASVKQVFDLFEREEPLKISTIINRTGMSKKTVRFALNWLLETNIITKTPDLSDLRTYNYFLKA